MRYDEPVEIESLDSTTPNTRAFDDEQPGSSWEKGDDADLGF